MAREHSTNGIHPAAEEFISRLGMAAQAEGMPPIAGRLMALLLLEPEPLTFDELASRLQVSRGSVSTNTRLLESLGIIERSSQLGDRHDYYRISPDPYGRLVAGQLERMQRTAIIVARARASLPPEKFAEGHERLSKMERFYKFAIGNTQAFLDGWQSQEDA